MIKIFFKKEQKPCFTVCPLIILRLSNQHGYHSPGKKPVKKFWGDKGR